MSKWEGIKHGSEKKLDRRDGYMDWKLNGLSGSQKRGGKKITQQVNCGKWRFIPGSRELGYQRAYSGMTQKGPGGEWHGIALEAYLWEASQVSGPHDSKSLPPYSAEHKQFPNYTPGENFL